MRRRYQIVLSHSAPTDQSQPALPLSLWGRIKLFFGGLLLAAIVVSTLILMLVVGSMIAIVTGVLLIAAIAVAIVRLTLRRTRR